MSLEKGKKLRIWKSKYPGLEELPYIYFSFQPVLFVLWLPILYLSIRAWFSKRPSDYLRPSTSISLFKGMFHVHTSKKHWIVGAFQLPDKTFNKVYQAPYGFAVYDCAMQGSTLASMESLGKVFNLRLIADCSVPGKEIEACVNDILIKLSKASKNWIQFDFNSGSNSGRRFWTSSKVYNQTHYLSNSELFPIENSLYNFSNIEEFKHEGLIFFLAFEMKKW